MTVAPRFVDAGDGVVLTRLARDHAPFVRALFADGRVAAGFVDPSALRTPRGARAFSIASADLTGEHRFAAVGSDAPGPIGLGTVRDDVAARGFATIAYAVAPAVWGRGRGTAIAQRLCAFAFGVLGAPEVRASVKSSNAASSRVLEKLAFRAIGRVERAGRADARVELVEHALARDAWTARGASVRRSRPGT